MSAYVSNVMLYGLVCPRQPACYVHLAVCTQRPTPVRRLWSKAGKAARALPPGGLLASPAPHWLAQYIEFNTLASHLDISPLPSFLFMCPFLLRCPHVCACFLCPLSTCD